MNIKFRECPICGVGTRYLQEHARKCHPNYKWGQVLAMWKGLPEIPKCPVCGKEVEPDFTSNHGKKGYEFHVCCSKKCAAIYRNVNGLNKPKGVMRVSDTKLSWLYVAGFWDEINSEYCCKVGKSRNWKSRIWEFQSMGYNPIRILIYENVEVEIHKLEFEIHHSNFERKDMEHREVRGNRSNGRTEWYQPQEFKKIKRYLEDVLELELEDVSQEFKK